MNCCSRQRTRVIRWTLLTSLLGVAFSAGTSCNDTLQSALLAGARSTASALLNAFFDDLASNDNFTPVTVKAIQ